MLAARPAYRSRHMASVRSAPRAQPRTAPRSPNSRRYSDGKEAAWHRSIRARLIERASRKTPCPKWPEERRTNILVPHLVQRCGSDREKISDFRGLILWWCGREVVPLSNKLNRLM